MRLAVAVTLFALVGMFVSAVPSAAQKKFTGSLYLGGSSVGPSSSGESEFEAFDAVGGGVVNIHYLIHPAVGIGAELGLYSFGTDSRGFERTNTGNTLRLRFEGDQGLKARQATVQILGRLTRGKLRPFAGGGAGVYVVRTSLNGTMTFEDIDPGSTDPPVYDPPIVVPVDETSGKAKFGFNLGGGLEFGPETAALAVGLQARWHVVTNVDLNLDETGNTLNFLMLMIGVSFR